MIPRATFRPTAVLVALLFCVVLSGCKSKITKANYEKITDGMNLNEVQNLIGEGTLQGDGSGTAAQFGVNLPQAPTVGGGERYVWESGDKTITIIFRQGKVAWKDAKGF